MAVFPGPDSSTHEDPPSLPYTAQARRLCCGSLLWRQRFRFSHSPSIHDFLNRPHARAGQETVLWELSLRVTRRAAEAAGPLERALELLASIGDMLMRNGWHGIQRQQD